MTLSVSGSPARSRELDLIMSPFQLEVFCGSSAISPRRAGINKLQFMVEKTHSHNLVSFCGNCLPHLALQSKKTNTSPLHAPPNSKKNQTLLHHNMDISLLNYCTNLLYAPYVEQAYLHYRIIQGSVLKADSGFTSVLFHRDLEIPKILLPFVYN